MNYFEQEYREYVQNHIITTHIVLFFILLGVLIIDFKLTPQDAHLISINFLTFSIFLIIQSALLQLINRNKPHNIQIKSDLLKLIYVTFPFLMTVLILTITSYGAYIKYILIIPVLIAGSIMGKKISYAFSVLCIFTLFIHEGFLDLSKIDLFVEHNFTLIYLLFFVGWFSGTISELDLKYRNHMKNIANTDYLTGLYTHRYFYEKVEELSKSTESGQLLSLIIIDIDDFKYYNDTYGHISGDYILKEIGAILNTYISEPSFIARYGGEEFIIVLPGCNTEKAKNIAEEICSKVREHSFANKYVDNIKLTISCGLATSPTHTDNYKELIDLSDQALLKAKSLGKNRVEVYSSIFDELNTILNEEEKHLVGSFQTLIKVINAKDRYTYGHSERVMEYSIRLAKKINLDKGELDLLRYAAFLHDVGKIEIDRDLLNKPTGLNNKEFEIFKKHTMWGYEIVTALPSLKDSARIILYHHENYDGSGYPTGLSGEEIPLLSRIIRIADSYDAMTSSRPYCKAMTHHEAMNELKRNSGTQFDPELVEIFHNAVY